MVCATEYKRKKNILYVEANRDGTVGGSHHCLLEIVANLNKDIYNPSVLFFKNNSLVPIFERYGKVHIFETSKGIDLKRSPGWLFRPFIRLFQKVFNFFNSFLMDILRMSLLLYRNKIDLIHLNNGPRQPEVFFAGKLANAKIIAHLRGTFRGKRSLMETALIPYYDAFIPISRSVESFNRSLSKKLPEMQLIFDGIDFTAVLNCVSKKDGNIRHEFSLDNHRPFIGLINNIKDWKGQHVAVEAMNILHSKYPGMVCLLVGSVSDAEADIKYYEYLKLLIDRFKLHNNIIFTGYRKDVIDIINSLDIVLHTSLGNEGFPRVILETMTLGKPLIASSIGPNTEMISDGKDGFLFETNNHEELAAKIELLLSNERLRIEIGENASRKIRNCFDIKGNVTKIEELYQGIFSHNLRKNTASIQKGELS